MSYDMIDRFLRNNLGDDDYAKYSAALDSLCTPQPKETEQEPVAYIKTAELEELKHCNGMSLWAENAAIHTEDSISKQLLPSGHVPVYTTPPQRTWVGLDDTDLAVCGDEDDVMLARYWERVCKEKNT